MKYISSLLRILLPAALLLPASSRAVTVRDVSDSSMTPSLTMPESAETNTRTMQENWYLRTYAVLDSEADSRENVQLTDEEIMERLSRLPVTIEMPFNSVVGNSIRYYANRRQLVENMLGLSLYYMPIFEEALERHGLPRELRYLPVIESALVPNARSRAGAGGLWQFMPATGSGFGLEQNSLVDQRYDPYSSSEAAAVYLKQLYNTFNDWSLAIAAYNCGPGNINKAMRRAGEGQHDFWEIYPFLPAETRGYFPAFIAANYIMTYHKDHNISPALARRPIVTDTVHVSRRVHFQQIADVMNIPMEELRALNPQYIRDVIPGDIKPYPLTLPSLQAYAYVANEDSIVNHEAERYARRGMVEPATAGTVGRDARGEYYDEEVVQWHTVRRGETLASIANHYGTTQRAIRRDNNCGRTVRRGQRLKIKTTVRRYREAAPEQAPAVEMAMDSIVPAAGDSVSVVLPAENIDVPAEVTAAQDSVNVSRQAEAVNNAFSESAETENLPSPAADEPTERPVSVPAQTPARQQNTERQSQRAGRQNQSNSRRYHTVRRGENLSKIAARYGTTVAAIKRANNMAGDNIQAGQRIIIP